MTLREAWEAGKEALRQAGIPDADLDAWYLLEYITGITRTVYFAEPGMQLEDGQYDRYRSLIKKRAEHVPLQHLTGEQECILISVLYYALKNQLFRTGSSPAVCILGTGADLSDKALAVAEENASIHQVEATFVQGDLFENIEGRYGMILSNPPYIPTAEIDRLQDEVKMHDPICALDGREDGLFFYRRIVKESRAYLEKGGMLIFEIGYDQAREVSELMRQAGFSDVQVRKDLAGLDRVVSGRYDNEWKG